MRILHFEYSEFFRRVIHDMVLRGGHAYYDSNRGGDLFKLLAHEEIDIIITGMELADMSGETLIRDLKESKYGNIPIIVITSSEVENLNKRLKGLPINDFIIKEQLSLESLNQTLDRLEDLIENNR